MKSVMNQPQVDTAHDPRDSSRPDIHHGHSSIVRSKSKISEKVWSTSVRNSGRPLLNRNESKLKFRRNHILAPRKNEFRNYRSVSENYRKAKFEAGISKQELRTYVYDQRHSNSFRGTRPPRWPTVLYPDNSLDSFVDMSLSIWLIHKLRHKFTCMYQPTFALRTTSAFPGLALCTTMAYWYLST